MLAACFTARAAEGSLDWTQFDERTNEFLKDKLPNAYQPSPRQVGRSSSSSGRRVSKGDR